VPGLLFIELPNWESLGRRLRGPRWSQMKPPEHINFYSPSTLRHAVSAAGFCVIRLSTEYPSIMDRAEVRRPSRPLHRLLALAAAVACRFGMGVYVRILARKAALE